MSKAEKILSNIFPEDEIIREYSPSELKGFAERAMKVHITTTLQDIREEVEQIVIDWKEVGDYESASAGSYILHKLQNHIDDE